MSGFLLDTKRKSKREFHEEMYPFGVIKCPSRFIKVNCKGTAKNKARLITIYALRKM